ncbi:hypothetical protein C2G38_2198395 [Gigaspora rosea]|uniref:Uncharacterized protein n=1 Tax=Gigaspora rosea TaxID=44941 RepID=A0A397USY7_9GLOM|nr:hypothetical protein C2G38_2198395 [Gigaspora rosea]
MDETTPLSTSYLYTFDVISSGGGILSGSYKVLSQDRMNKGRLCEGDVKTITIVNEHARKLSNSTFVYTEYLGYKPLNLCDVEYHGSHDPDHVRKKLLRMANSVRKTITNRAANITPSILATELMNSAKILSTIVTTPKNQAQPTSTWFVSNLEAIQNALKYDKKQHYPSVSEYEKSESTTILKQYGVKDAQDPKKQAVILGIASTIMPTLLTKYPDFLAMDSTGRRNSLNFPNTAFMIRSDEPRGQIIATFISDKKTIPVINLMFESVGLYVKNDVQLNSKWLAIDKWDPYLVATRKYFPNAQIVLCDWHEADTLKEWFTKNLNNQWIRDRAFYQFRFVKRSRDQDEFNQRKITILDAKEFQSATGITNLAIAENDTWIVSRFGIDIDTQYVAAESDDDSDKESSRSETPDLFDEDNIKQQVKTLYITRRSGNLLALVVSIPSNNKSELKRPVEESVTSSSLESYLLPGEQVHLRDTISDEPYHKVQIVEVIGEDKIIVDVTFESGNTNQYIVQLADIIGYADEQNSYGNTIVHTLLYGGKKGEVHLTSTCSVDTGLTLIQSAFTQQNIYSQAVAFAIANPTSYTHLLIKHWEEPCVVSCGLEFVTINRRNPKNVPKNAFKVDKYTSVESGKLKFYLESKDLPEEIRFPLKDTLKQRYRLMGVSFCNSNHHVADVRFENVKNAEWYQYDGLGKTYCTRAMYIGSSRPSHKDGYAMDFAIYVKI